MMAGVVFMSNTEANVDKRQEILRIIKERQEYVETHEDCNPIAIFPEGVASNNKYLNSFKKGAFDALKSVKPIVLKYTPSDISTQVNRYAIWPIQIMLTASLKPTVVEVSELPIFIPNDYLFETHKDKGKEKWEIFAWAVQDVIAKVGNFDKTDYSIRHSVNHQRSLFGLPLYDSVEQPIEKPKTD